MVQTLPLTVLAYPGPQVRAYLSRLHSAGFRPTRIIVAVLDHNPSTRKPIGRFLPAGWRLRYAAAAQEQAFMFWPRHIASTYPGMMAAIKKFMTLEYPQAPALITGMLGKFRYEQYADRVDYVLVSGINDARLRAVLADGPAGAVLFTGGGILKPDILSVPNTRFIHVHPGYLPYVAGADGLLWSMKQRGKVGLSAFYMTPSLDGGNIIARREYPPVYFNLGQVARPDDAALYRALFSFCDPLLRAEFLVHEVLSKGAAPANLPSQAQDISQRTVYRFMPPAEKHEVLKAIFSSQGAHARQ